jgi:hypothetical protein
MRNVSSDSTVFFQTSSALRSGDVNGVADVYEWGGGWVELVSAGTGPAHSIFGDASVDGSSVFFMSADGLVDGVEPGTVRVFAARAGGGFVPAEAKQPCTGGDCRPAGASGPGEVAPGSGAVVGRGNVVVQRSCLRVAREASRLGRQARRLRRAAARASTPAAVRALRRRAVRAKRQAKRRSSLARRCRAQAVRADVERGVGR